MAELPEKEFIIEVKDLTKRFNGFVAVNRISFRVANGEIFAFLGPNGAGKTTTIKMLTTLLKPTSGEIRINGFSPLSEPFAVRSSFGIVFQDPSLDDELTAIENMEFHAVLYNMPRVLRRDRIERLLRLVDLWERRDMLVKKFSGGMKRRLEIARGLLHTPRILFLDEPTLGLDPQTRNLIWTHILELNKKEGVTIFLTTHYLEEAEKVASQIAIIDQGKIVAQGTIEELREKTGKQNLEEAYLDITGSTVRAEESTNLDRMRIRRQMMH
jgi:ABC-2 type transport system ATP-binding protein